jgi:cysteine synthase
LDGQVKTLVKLPAIFDRANNTPLVPIELIAPEGTPVSVLVKLEGTNPSGSVKDRAAIEMIRDKIETGSLTQKTAILDASSGNMASALALYGAALGVAVTVVCNPTLTTDKRRMITYFGARLIENDLGPYTFDGYRKCLEILADAPTDRYCFLDQLHNPANPAAHQHSTGPEIIHQVPDVRMVVGSLGSGGTMLGVARAFRQAGSTAYIAAVCSASGTRFPGVGAFDDGDYHTPFINAAYKEKAFDATMRIHHDEAMFQLTVLRHHGLFCGPQTGAVLAGALHAAELTGIHDRIVVISGDAGWKNWNYLGQVQP